MIKMTYVLNTIRIPIHGVDFSHQRLGFGERIKPSYSSSVKENNSVSSGAGPAEFDACQDPRGHRQGGNHKQAE
jgi:hypothetical protein